MCADGRSRCSLMTLALVALALFWAFGPASGPAWAAEAASLAPTAAVGGAEWKPPPYPRVSWVCGERVGHESLPAPADRALALEWVPQDGDALAEMLRESLADGGCAAVLCNTVRRAQGIYLALREARVVPEGEVTLFHSRFPA